MNVSCCTVDVYTIIIKCHSSSYLATTDYYYSTDIHIKTQSKRKKRAIVQFFQISLFSEYCCDMLLSYINKMLILENKEKSQSQSSAFLVQEMSGTTSVQ